MFSNRRDVFKNGTKSLPYSEYTIYSDVKHRGFVNDIPNRTRMEKIFLVTLSWIGFTSYIGAILLNIGNWKADVLWCIACMFGVVRVVRYSLKTWQDFRRGEIDIKLKRKESDK
jgi:hypothetical protein